MKKIYSLPSGDLASRSSAIPYRNELERALSFDSSVICLDLKNVYSISESYADELFGVLVMSYGLDYFLERMELVNVDEYVLESIASVIDRRAPVNFV